MTPARHLVAFVKAPRIGRVKTRLGRDIGMVAARSFYWRTTRKILAELRGAGRWQPWLAVTPDAAVDAGRMWPAGWRRFGQGPGDLGERMARTMRLMPPGPVVIVGTDIPDLRARHVERAFRALGDHDAVFGPAADGGYWLVGLRRSPGIPDIFRGGAVVHQLRPGGHAGQSRASGGWRCWKRWRTSTTATIGAAGGGAREDQWATWSRAMYRPPSTPENSSSTCGCEMGSPLSSGTRFCSET